MDLKEYEQSKFSMAEIIRSAQAVDTKDQDLLLTSRNLLMRLADDRFNLMLVGRFNRGKSTLINAILGASHLPTGILPLTSVITTVRYGSRTRAVINFKNRQLRQEIPFARLSEYVTQQSNPGNVKDVTYAEIELPVELLRRGLFFVDSPGLESAIIENTQTTERFFPEADAFVLITSYDSPLSHEENLALDRIRQTDKALFVIVNKQDTVGDDEQKQVLSFIKAQLEEFSFLSAPKIFSISARQALEGKQLEKSDLVTSSGILRFEEELLRFLIEERAEAFLSNMYERIEDFLVLRRNLEREVEKQSMYQSLLERFHDLREPKSAPSAPAKYIEDTTSRRFTLKLDRRSGCGLCGEVLDEVFHFLSKYQYDLTINRDTQREHARRGGFCSLHTWQYENISSPYGVCTSYPELSHQTASELQQVATETRGSSWTREKVMGLGGSQETCRVCQVRIDAEKRAVDRVVRNLQGLDAPSNVNLPACCLPHLRMIVGVLGKSRAAELLLKAHAQFFERIAEDAQRYALRHDALRRYLTSEEERRASQLMLLMLSGHRSLCAPWNVQSLV